MPSTIDVGYTPEMTPGAENISNMNKFTNIGTVFILCMEPYMMTANQLVFFRMIYETAPLIFGRV